MSPAPCRSEEHTSELQSPCKLVCRLLLEKKKLGSSREARPTTTALRERCSMLTLHRRHSGSRCTNWSRAALFFFFHDTATTEIYTLSLHDALPISLPADRRRVRRRPRRLEPPRRRGHDRYRDRKSTRLNSSHLVISYAVFCLKKKKKKQSPLSHASKTKHNNNTTQTQ